MTDPPVVTLAEGKRWKLDLVAYPSGTYLEVIYRNALVFSEHIDRVAKVAENLQKGAV